MDKACLMIPVAGETQKIEGYPQEEIRKLHTEILQLDNQRFLLTTTAVVLFGTVAGWVTTALLRSSGAGAGIQSTVNRNYPPEIYLPLVSTVLVCLVVTALFYFQLSKARTIRWLAAYLLLQGSKWEWIWFTFRKMEHGDGPGRLPFFGIHRVTTLIFVVLTWTTLCYFLSLQIFVFGTLLDRWTFAPSGILPWSLVALFITILTAWMYRSNAKILHADEMAYMRRWAEAERQAVSRRAAFLN